MANTHAHTCKCAYLLANTHTHAFGSLLNYTPAWASWIESGSQQSVQCNDKQQ